MKKLVTAGALAAALVTSAYGATKRLIAHSRGAFESQMVLESETIARQATSADAAEGVGAFLEKRPARFPGKGPR